MATLIPGIGTSADKLHAELRVLIASSRQRLAGAFPAPAIVSTLSTKLRWSHLVAIAGHAEPDAAANSPAQVFKDPYFLYFLGLRQGRDEGYLEAGITVAEYGTELPPKAALEQKLHAALLEARERLARRGCCWGTWSMSDDRKGCKGLGFPVVALTGVGYVPMADGDEEEAARVFYVAARRAVQRLMIGVSGIGSFRDMCWTQNYTSNLAYKTKANE